VVAESNNALPIDVQLICHYEVGGWERYH
jgi:hypothetical protein